MWQSAISGIRRAKAMQVACEVVARLRDCDRVNEAARASIGQTSYPRSVHWRPASMAQGYAGLALMCSYLDTCFPNDGWDVTGHHCLELASHDDLGRLSPSLYSGLSGLAFAAWHLSRGETRYRKLLGTLDRALVPAAADLARRLADTRGGPVHEFDIVSGAAGVGAYLLCRRDNIAAMDALRTLLNSLVQLSGTKARLPRWYTPAESLDETMLPLSPWGNLNCGLAHGIPGPLALLALAQLSGVVVDASVDAIHTIANWLISNRADDEWGVNWPTIVPLAKLEEERAAGDGHGLATPTPSLSGRRPSRTAWCYGSPGVARALWLAGRAVDKQEYCEIALDAAAAVYRRPLRARQIDSPTFCHGVAGLLQITLRFANETQNEPFGKAAATLCDQLIELYDPATRLGYYSLEPAGNRVDQPGLLDGAAGVPLVLLAACVPCEPSWDRFFLLS